MTPSVRRDRPALAAAALDEHLVRARARGRPTRKRPPSSSSNSPACERLLHRAQLLAEPRPEHRQVRLHAQLGASTRPKRDVLHAHLVGDLVGVRCRAARALDDEPPQRLAQLEPRRRARLMRRARRRGARPRSRRAARGPARRRPASRRDAPTPARRGTRLRQRCSVRNGMTGASTRSVWTSAYQSVSQRGRVPVPEARAASGGCTSSRDRRRTPRTRASRRRVRYAS